MSGRLAVGVSGAGSNLRALVAAADRAELGGSIALVFGDRECPALAWAAEQGIETALVPGLAGKDAATRAAADAALLETLRAARVDAVVLAGYMRVVGPAVLGAYPDRILNTHPSLLPSFPGAHAVRDALEHGVAVTGCTVHFVDDTLDGGPIVAQEAVPILAGDTEASLHDRIRAVEHRLLPRAAAGLLAGAIRRVDGGRRVEIDLARADATMPVPKRALLSVSDKHSLADLGAGLVRLGFELVSTGGTARTLREAGLPVTDVASVTGFPEMLDGRVKTLHPRIHAGILADRRSDDHRRQLLAAAIAPFDVVVVNLYPFAAATERPGIELDELVEEIDIGGPSLIRAAAKNHASVAVVTSPDRYEAVLEALQAEGAVPAPLRSALAAEAFAHTAAYDARIAVELPARMAASMAAAGAALPDWPGLPGASDPYPPTLTIGLEKVEGLRYGENPHQPAARYRRPGPAAEEGPFSAGQIPLQGKGLSYNNVLDASAAAALVRGIAEPACVIVKHTNPCGAAIRGDIGEAWAAALAADPISAFGGIVAVTRPVDATLAARLTSIFLEVVVAPAYDEAALEILGGKPGLRLLVDESLEPVPDAAADSVAASPGPAATVSPTAAIRTAGGAVLVSAPDSLNDDPSHWTVATRRSPSPEERADLALAWRLVRGVMSNAIALVKDQALIGIGSGQTSRVDAAFGAVEKAQRFAGIEGLIGAACASDAFYPFPDAVEACIDAGVAAYVQPGGSIRDAEAIAAVDAAGGTMLVTGTRHFRH